MFVRHRDKRRPTAIYKIRHGDISKYSTLQDIVELVQQFGFPYTVHTLPSTNLNLIVYTPNDVLEFDLERRMY